MNGGVRDAVDTEMDDTEGGVSANERQDAASSTAGEPPDRGELQTRLAVLEAENRQLRAEYTRARQAVYRRLAVGLFGVGVIGILGGVGFPDARPVLFALGGTGIFAGVLTSVLTPERFVSARIGARVFQALRADRDAIVSELGLGGKPVYLPTDDDVRLFIPRYEETPLPERTAIEDVFAVPTEPDHGGVAFHPTGGPLFAELESTRTQPVESTPADVATVTADALVELFELADGVEYDVDTATNRITFEVAGAGLGDPTAVDHPVQSFLAVGIAQTLDVTVRVDVREEPLTITCRYENQE